ncbi:hypothetical protein Taro_023509 [Colocasia esculenta]|uniref:Uncharacterized protein n=1 Tax=Colocasia esculenta TaxID=4460 RepID=A0A843UXM0_COLES|nr:hypothetical protein [Colocasia esculenta]
MISFLGQRRVGRPWSWWFHLRLCPTGSEEDLNVYASLYEKSGFSFALQMALVRRRNCKKHQMYQRLTASTALLFMGENRLCYQNFQGMKDYKKSGKVKNYVPDLESSSFL